MLIFLYVDRLALITDHFINTLEQVFFLPLYVISQVPHVVARILNKVLATHSRTRDDRFNVISKLATQFSDCPVVGWHVLEVNSKIRPAFL